METNQDVFLEMNQADFLEMNLLEIAYIMGHYHKKFILLALHQNNNN